MKKGHTLPLLGALTAAGVIAASLATVAGQAGQTATKQAANAPKTAWGTPDLQGIWHNDELVPFERDAAKFGNREFKTDAEMTEALDILLERNKRPGRDSRIIGGKNAVGTEKDVARAYNEHWFGDKPTKVGRRTSQVVDPPDGRVPALTADAQKKRDEKREFLAALLQGTSGGRPGPISPRRTERSPDYNLDRINRTDDPEDRGGAERCLGNGLPVDIAAGSFGGNVRITQSPDSVALYYDVGQGSGFARVVPITNAPHLNPSVRPYHGDSRARWEGDTLVVDTTNFSKKTNYRGSRETLHLIERYRRLDAKTLEIRTTIEDPTTFTKPWTWVQTLEPESEKRNLVLEGGCHEGNYGMLGMLANTRTAEKLFKEGKGPNPDLQDNATGGGAE